MSNLNAKIPNIEFFNPDLKSVLTEDEEANYLFIVADREKASLYLFNKGILKASRKFLHEGVEKLVKSDSGELHGRNDKFARHIDKELHEHIQLMMQEVETLIKGTHINGVFIGGHKPLFTILESELPKLMQQKVRGTFTTELNISQNELIKHCLKVLIEYKK